MNTAAFTGSKSPNANIGKSMHYGYSSLNDRNKPYNKSNGKGLNGV